MDKLDLSAFGDPVEENDAPDFSAYGDPVESKPPRVKGWRQPKNDKYRLAPEEIGPNGEEWYSADNPPYDENAFVAERQTVGGRDYFRHSETGEIYDATTNKITGDPAILKAFGKTQPTQVAQRRLNPTKTYTGVGEGIKAEALDLSAFGDPVEDPWNKPTPYSEYASEFGNAIPRGAANTVSTMATGLSALTSDAPVAVRQAEEGIANLSTMTPEDATAFMRSLPTSGLNPIAALNYQMAIRALWNGDTAKGEGYLATARRYVDTTPVEDQALTKAGKGLAEAAKEEFPTGPGWEGSVTTQIGEGLGSTVPFVPLGLAGGATAVTAAGAAAGAGEQYDTAKRDIATARRDDRAGLYNAGLGTEAERKAMQAAQMGAAPGASETIPIEILIDQTAKRFPALRAVANTPIWGKWLKAAGRIGSQAMVEGGQEGFQQWLQNVINKVTLDPEQEVTEAVLQNALIGGAIGGGMQTAVEGVNAVLPGKKEPPTAPPPPPAPTTRTEPKMDFSAFGDPVQPTAPPPASAPPPVGTAPMAPGRPGTPVTLAETGMDFASANVFDQFDGAEGSGRTAEGTPPAPGAAPMAPRVTPQEITSETVPEQTVESENAPQITPEEITSARDRAPAFQPTPEQSGALDKILSGKTAITPEALAPLVGGDTKVAGQLIQKAIQERRLLQTRGKWMTRGDGTQYYKEGRLIRPPKRVKPVSALEAIAAAGGISDPTGELKALDAHRKMTPYGPLVRPTGMHPDKARELLLQDGYLLDPGWNTGAEQQTTVADVYNLISTEMAGQKIYRTEDLAEAEAIETERKNALANPEAREAPAASRDMLEKNYGPDIRAEVIAAAEAMDIAKAELDQAAQYMMDGMTAENAVERAVIGAEDAIMEAAAEWPELKAMVEVRNRMRPADEDVGFDAPVSQSEPEPATVQEEVVPDAESAAAPGDGEPSAPDGEEGVGPVDEEATPARSEQAAGAGEAVSEDIEGLIATARDRATGLTDPYDWVDAYSADPYQAMDQLDAAAQANREAERAILRKYKTAKAYDLDEDALTPTERDFLFYNTNSVDSDLRGQLQRVTEPVISMDEATTEMSYAVRKMKPKDQAGTEEPFILARMNYLYGEIERLGGDPMATLKAAVSEYASRIEDPQDREFLARNILERVRERMDVPAAEVPALPAPAEPEPAPERVEPQAEKPKRRYEYAAKYRPPGYATVPEGYVEITPPTSEHKFGTVIYEKPLSFADEDRFELQPLDPGHPRNIRKAIEAFTDKFRTEFSEAGEAYHLAKKITDADGRPLTKEIIVTPSTRDGVEWQLTSLDDFGASGHIDFNDFDDLARQVYSYVRDGYERVDDTAPPPAAAEPGADNRPQLTIPGTEPDVKGAMQNAAKKPLKAKAPQKDADEGLFGEAGAQADLVQTLADAIKQAVEIVRKDEKAAAPAAEPTPAPETPAVDPADAALLEGLPEGAALRQGKGVLARDKWAVFAANGDMLGDYGKTKEEAVRNARERLGNRAANEKAAAEKADLEQKIATRIMEGGEPTDSDLANLRLKPKVDFGVISPIVQRLFGISRAKVREAMGTAVRKGYNDFGGVIWMVYSKMALTNAAKWKNAQSTPTPTPEPEAKVEEKPPEPVPVPTPADNGNIILGNIYEQYAGRTIQDLRADRGANPVRHPANMGGLSEDGPGVAGGRLDQAGRNQNGNEGDRQAAVSDLGRVESAPRTADEAKALIDRLVADRDRLRALNVKAQALSRKIFGRGLRIEVFDQMPSYVPKDFIAAYNPAERATLLSLRAAQQMAFNVGHEGLHYLRHMGAITAAEWRILVKAAKERKSLTPERIAIYRREYMDRYGMNERQFMDRMEEEAVADMLGDYVNGWEASGPVARILARIKEFIEALQSLLRGEGFTTATGILSAANRGDLARRIDGDTAMEPAPVAGNARDITQTPAFKAWFRDSKVVDENGKPLVVYHGTNANITEFRKEKLGSASSARSAKLGFFFADEPAVASSYADKSNPYQDTDSKFISTLMRITKGRYERYNEAIANLFGKTAYPTGQNVLPVYLKMENPKRFDMSDPTWEAEGLSNLLEFAREAGHDGVIFENIIDPGYSIDYGMPAAVDPATHYVVFEPTQIKSAFNSGAFDPNNPSILGMAPADDGGRGITGTRLPSPMELAGPEADTTGLDGIVGNLNLTKIKAPTDIKAMLKQVSDDADGFMGARRGVVSHEQTRQLAAELGMSAADLLKRKEGQAFNAHELFAARVILLKSAEAVKKSAAKASTSGSDIDRAEFMRIFTRHAAIQEQVAGMTAEAGRALNQFKMLAGADFLKGMKDLLSEKSHKGKFGTEAVDDLANMVNTLSDAAGIGKFARAAFKPTFLDMIREYWINALLSGPTTQTVNFVSNLLVAIGQIPETWIAEQLGTFRDGSRVQSGEATARAFGLMAGARDGLQMAWLTLKAGEPQSPETRFDQPMQKAIPGIVGEIVRVPTRLMMTADEFFKSINYRADLYAQAYRKAREEGLDGDALYDRMADLIENPTLAMMRQAKDFAKYQTFQNKLGPKGQALMKTRESWHLWPILPFLRTPINILKFAAERTPLMFLVKDARDNLMGRNGAAARDMQISRVALGSMLAAGAVSMAMAGMLTGGGPDDEREKAILRAGGWQPYSIKINGVYYNYLRFDPFSLQIGIAADMVEAAEKLSAAEYEEMGWMLAASIINNISDKTWMTGVTRFNEAVQNPQQFIEGYVQDLGASFVPNLFAQGARVMDPAYRDARDMLDKIKARVPGLRETLATRRNVFGEPIIGEGAAGPDILSPVYFATERNQDLIAAFKDAEYYPSMPKREINGHELTPAQYERYSEIAGEMALKDMRRVIARPSWKRFDIDKRADLLKRVFDDARRDAREAMKKQFPDLRKKVAE